MSIIFVLLQSNVVVETFDGLDVIMLNGGLKLTISAAGIFLACGTILAALIAKATAV